MLGQQNKTSIREIAQKAGVSPTLVSAILLKENSRAANVRFSEATAERVRNVAGALGYISNRLTRSIIRREAFAVAAISTWALNERYDSIIRALAMKFQKEGYHLILEPCGRTHQEIMERLRALVALQVGAVFLIPPRSASADMNVVRQEYQEKLAVFPNIICGGWGHEEFFFDCVDSDERAAVTLPLKHLYEKGHRRIAFIGNRTPLRCRLIVEEMTALGLESGLELAQAGLLTPENRNLSMEDVPGIIRNIFSSGNRPTALYFWYDSSAAIAYRVCEEEFGLKVGRDIAIVGQGNTELSRLLPVPLTTVDHRNDDFASELHRLLMDRVSGGLPEDPVRRVLKPELVVRESSDFELPEK